MNVTNTLSKLMKYIMNFKMTNNKEKKLKVFVKWFFFNFRGLSDPLDHF